MSGTPELEASYRRLMRAFPRGYRLRREEEMLAVLLEGADGAQHRATRAEGVDLLRAGAAARLRLLAADPVALAGLATAVVLLMLSGALFTALAEVRGQFVTGAVATRPALPERFPDGSPVPAAARAHPGGAAIAAYVTGHEDFEMFQQLVGAGRPTARMGTWGRLSPDGRALAYTGQTGDWVTGVGGGKPGGSPLRVLDLVSGRSAKVPGILLRPDDAVVAWSRDARQLAVRRAGRIAVVERATGQATDIGVGATAAFGVVDDRLAVQDGRELRVLQGSSVVARAEVDGYVIAAAGWSPDGQRLALHEPPTPPNSYGYGDLAASGSRPAVIDLTSGLVTPVGATGRPVAWRSATSLLLFRDVSEGSTLTAVELMSLQRRTVSRFTPWGDAHGLQLATGLTAGATATGQHRFDRGPVQLVDSSTVLAVAVLGCWLVFNLVFHPLGPVPRTPREAARRIRHRAMMPALLLVPWFAAMALYLSVHPDAPLKMLALLALSLSMYAAVKSVVRSQRFPTQAG